MKVTTTTPQKEYPYLAVWVGRDMITSIDIANIKQSEIVLISMVDIDTDKDKQPYVQYLFGGQPAYVTQNENEYFPLPKGFTVTICQ